jgi:hypothetical protein
MSRNKNKKSPDKGNSYNTTVIIAFIGLVGTIITAYFGFRASTEPTAMIISATQTAQLSTLSTGFTPAAIVATNTIPQATESSPQLGETQTSDPITLLREAENWTIVLDDTFDNNSAGWNLDGWDSENTKIFMEIQGGQFNWKMQEFRKGTWYYWEIAPLDSYSNFYLSARIGRAPGAKFPSYYGVLFKRQGDELYEFVVDSWGQYAVSLFKDGKWTYLAGPTKRVFLK